MKACLPRFNHFCTHVENVQLHAAGDGEICAIRNILVKGGHIHPVIQDQFLALYKIIKKIYIRRPTNHYELRDALSIIQCGGHYWQRNNEPSVIM